MTSYRSNATPDHLSVQFTLLDLELLHHFTTSTSLTLSKEPQARNFWRISVPQIAFSNPYVLKNVLALSALHCARLKPDQRDFYDDLALAYHDEASTSMQLVSDLTSENIKALLSFTWLNTLFAFGRPRDAANLLIVENGAVPDWLVHLRGARSMGESADNSQFASGLAAVTRSAMEVNTLWETSSYECEALGELRNAFKKDISDSHKLTALGGALNGLERSYGIVFRSSDPEEHKMRATLIWLYKLSDDYMDLLKIGDDAAMCLLAFFCVLLQRLNHYWWIDGWGRHLIERICSSLSPGYMLWIQWALEEVGWAPVS